MAALTQAELTSRLQEALAPMIVALRPEFVVLFGSYAYGTPDKYSDADLLIVLPDAPNRFFDRIDFVRQHLPPSPDLPRLELHIMTGEEYRRELLRRNVFIADITRKAIPLFSQRDWDEALLEVETLMQEGESLYPQDWLDEAQMDARRVEWLLVHADAFGAAYHLQQAVEKTLKAFLLAHDWHLERTHELPYLLNLAIQHEPTLQAFEPLCQRANEFIWERYPRALRQPPTHDELTTLLPQAQQLLQIMVNVLV